MLIQICHRCPFRQRPCSGKCLCDGIDIMERAKNNDCPKGYFDGPLTRKPMFNETEFDPLDDVKRDINRGGCGCSAPKE